MPLIRKRLQYRDKRPNVWHEDKIITNNTILLSDNHSVSRNPKAASPQSASCTFNDFARICNDYLWRIQFRYPKIQQTAKYCSVIVENRLTENLEFTIRNTISKLPDNWSHVIICSDTNHSKVTEIAISISPYIRVLNNLPNEFNRNDYNNLLLSEGFYELFKDYQYLFIYQTDTFIFPVEFPKEVLKYDFTGAPWGWSGNEQEIKRIYGISDVLVGNGGLSFRSVRFCLECLKSDNYKKYLKTPLYNDNLDKTQEDVFYGICSKIKKTDCPYETAYSFSHEPTGKSKMWLRVEECSFASHKIYDYFNNSYDLQQYLDYHFLPNIQKKVTIIGNDDLHFPKRKSNSELYVIISENREAKMDIFYYSFIKYIKHLINQINPIEFNRYYKIEICPNNPYFKIEVFNKNTPKILSEIKTIGFRERNGFRYNNYIYSKVDEITGSLLEKAENKFCINLCERKDRRYLVQQEFNKIGLNNVQFFSAVKPIPKLISESSLNPGEIGAFLSHYFLLKMAYENDYDDLLVLEDDVEFVNGFNLIFKQVFNDIPVDYDLVWIGGNEREPQNVRRSTGLYGIVPTHYYGCHCLLFSKSGIKKAYKAISEMGMVTQIDVFYSKYISNFIQYAFTIPLATQQWSVGNIYNYFYHNSMNYSNFYKQNEY